MVEHPRGDIALALGQACHGVVEVSPYDRFRAPEGIEGLETEDVGFCLALHLPKRLHHQLEIGRLDPRRAVIRKRPERTAETDSAALDLVEHGFDELGLDLHRLVPVLVVPGQRPENRVPGRRPVQALEREVVAKDVRNPAREDVELGERVLPQGKQHVHPQVRRPDDLRKRGREALGFRVDEELFELVEDEVHVTVEAAHRLGKPVRERELAVRGFDAELLRNCKDKPSGRIVGPGVVDDDSRVRGDRAQLADDASPEHGALPHAERPVEDREARGHHVRRDRVRVAFPAEEEERVELGVLEGGEALVRARDLCAPSVTVLPRHPRRAGGRASP